jgi:glycosyltransferase involved in cell wall biosynthesis
LTRADAAVIASLYETTPLTLLEAWAMHVPVVSTSVGILRGHETLAPVVLANTADARSLAVAMQKLIDGEAGTTEIVEKASRAVSRYQWSDIAKTAQGIYREAVC